MSGWTAGDPSALSRAGRTGLVVVDAGVVIAHFDGADPHHVAATAALREVAATATRLMLPVTALAECLVHPERAGGDVAERFMAALGSIPIGVADADLRTAREAARLRAGHPSLRLPDAFVIATAITHRADTLITTDRDWPQAAMSSFAFTLHVIGVT